MGLAKLYRVTGDEKYLALAKYFIDVRGPGGSEYSQAHLKPVNQTEAVGHAVRAGYLYRRHGGCRRAHRRRGLCQRD